MPRRSITLPLIAGAASSGGCSFVASSWGLSFGIGPLVLVFLLVTVTCLAGEAKVERDHGTHHSTK